MGGSEEIVPVSVPAFGWIQASTTTKSFLSLPRLGIQVIILTFTFSVNYTYAFRKSSGVDARRENIQKIYRYLEKNLSLLPNFNNTFSLENKVHKIWVK